MKKILSDVDACTGNGSTADSTFRHGIFMIVYSALGHILRMSEVQLHTRVGGGAVNRDGL